MREKLKQTIKPLFKSLLILSLVLGLTLGHANGAIAARSGGRIGGGSFRVPSSRTYNPPRSYAPGGGGYYPAPYPGGGFGFPFLIPFWGIGGGFGGLFSILIFIAFANFLVQAFRRVSSGESNDVGYSSNPEVSVTRLQVGLLASARALQPELNYIAETADTNSSEGRAEILQEASLALLRHPEYWVYASSETQLARLNSAEAQFNRLALAERSKFTAETLSNVNNQLKEAAPNNALPGNSVDNPTRLITEGPGEYIIVTLLAATLGKFQVPQVNSTEDLRQALRQIGSIPGEQLLAIELLWTPQAEGDTLTSDDLLAEYPNLNLV
ncbi:DUF1517 domain-containing protein [Iningainema tapete]|uniref:DUF1517 domain-containing protein n=1 Tax=Iningainema tapete BLCC-T55 TaxID=2748662 RepID=A0A8J7CFU1_9CYAN|nr:DUF1517 domain-containing protein [Iningainema tapete]MBD2775380.1 DUF1517 domain-containing protein [Iningainema tapete BLCC-T55]